MNHLIFRFPKLVKLLETSGEVVEKMGIIYSSFERGIFVTYTTYSANFSYRRPALCECTRFLAGLLYMPRYTVLA